VKNEVDTSVILFMINVDLFDYRQTCYLELIQKYGGPV
jgi:hypothetical protein